MLDNRSEQVKPIEVRHYGASGPEVVVLHGGPGAPGSVAELALLLSAQFTVLEPLQRRAGPLPLGVEQHVQDLLTIAPERAVVVGWSWGAMLGLSFAAQHPQRVSRLALIGCGTYDEVCREILIRTRRQRVGAPERARQRELEQRMRSTRDPRERDRVLSDLGKLLSAVDSYDELEDAELGADGASAPEPLLADSDGSAETWRDVLRLQREGVEPQRFANVRMPVLMLHGDHDPHPGPCTRERLRQYVPHLEYVGLERCGHRPWRERHAKAVFLDVLQAWIAAR